MILTDSVKKQLGLMAVLTAIALGLMVFVYARIPASLGIGVYNVKAEFKDASGLYPKALVTFHGVKVGQVSSLELTPTVAVATLRLDSGTSIPANVNAELHSTSAVGEQYVDLVPRGTAEGKLGDGTVLSTAHTVPMPQITPVLDSLNHLLKSVPLQSTHEVLDQINVGLGSSGSQVGQLIDSSNSLVQKAQQQISDTSGLIKALQPVLSQQQALAPSTLSAMSSLNAFTKELAAKDANLRALLTEGPGGLAKVGVTMADLQKSLPSLLKNVSVSGSVLNTYLANLKQILVVYPATIARLQSTVNPRASEGDVQLDLRAGAENPPSCSTGYVSTSDRRDPADTSLRSVNTLAHCSVAPSNPMSIRGARNLPCPNSSARGPLPSSCGLTFGKAIWPAGYSSSTGSTMSVGSSGSSSTGAAVTATAGTWPVVLAPIVHSFW